MSEPDPFNPYQPPSGDLSRPRRQPDLFEVLSRVAEGTEYPPEALMFLLEGLEFAKTHVQHPTETSGHIDGVDLSWCLHDWAMRRFGASARQTLESWNLNSTRDFGTVVYTLIDAGLMRASENDRIEDFDDVFEFAEQFQEHDFVPKVVDESDAG